jgi:hypothetical protein
MFVTDHKIAEYRVKDESLFPNPPGKCPHKGCHACVKQKKHGYYERNIISAEYTGTIYIRRYICPICGKTLSMLPMYCLPYYQYSLQAIFLVLCEYYCKFKSLSGIIREQQKSYPALERRHIRLYRKRLENNRQLIDYGINNISPGSPLSGNQLEIHVWAKELLDEMVKIPPSIFNQKFHQETNQSFMSRMKMIA